MKILNFLFSFTIGYVSCILLSNWLGEFGLPIIIGMMYVAIPNLRSSLTSRAERLEKSICNLNDRVLELESEMLVTKLGKDE